MKRLLQRMLWLAPLFLFLIPELAWAAAEQSTSLFTIPPGDLSKKYADQLFNNDGSSPFSSILLIINSGVMILGGFIISYALIHTIMTASNEGVLGKKFGTHWYVMRVTGAAIMMMPVKAGFSMATLLIVYIFNQSIGFADTIYTEVNKNNAKLVFATSPVNHSKAKELMIEMLRMTTCTASLEKTNMQVKANTGQDLAYWTSNYAAKFGVTHRSSPSGFELLYGNSADPLQVSACGRIMLKAPTTEIDSNMRSSNPQAQALQQVDKAVWAQKKEALLAANKILSDASVSFVQHHTKVLPAVENAIKQYEAAVKKAVVKEATQNATFQKVAQAQTSQGWITIGATYVHAVNFQQSLSQIVGKLPTVETSNGTNIVSETLTIRDMSALEKQLENEEADPSNLTLAQAAAMDQDNGTYLGFIKDPMGAIAKSMSRNLMNGNVFFGSESNSPNMLLSAAALGGKCLDFADFLLAVPVVMSQIPIVKDSSTTVAGIVFMVSGPLIITGLTLQNWLPMQPYLISLGVILSIFLAFCEAAIAANFWMLAHMMDGGNEETGAGAEGYKLLFGLFLQAPMFVVAFWVSMSILSIGSDFLYLTLNDAFDMTRGNNINVWGTLGELAIVAAAMHTVVLLAFTEIYAFGDRVCNWLGLNIRNNVSSHAQDMKHQSDRGHNVIVAGAMNVGQSVGQGGVALKRERNTNSNEDEKGGEANSSKPQFRAMLPKQPTKSFKTSKPPQRKE